MKKFVVITEFGEFKFEADWICNSELTENFMFYENEDDSIPIFICPANSVILVDEHAINYLNLKTQKHENINNNSV